MLNNRRTPQIGADFKSTKILFPNPNQRNFEIFYSVILERPCRRAKIFFI